MVEQLKMEKFHSSAYMVTSHKKNDLKKLFDKSLIYLVGREIRTRDQKVKRNHSA